MERRLTPTERLANRLGYMGTGFFVTAPHLLPDTPGVVIYFLAGLFCTLTLTNYHGEYRALIIDFAFWYIEFIFQDYK